MTPFNLALFPTNFSRLIGRRKTAPRGAPFWSFEGEAVPYGSMIGAVQISSLAPERRSVQTGKNLPSVPEREL